MRINLQKLGGNVDRMLSDVFPPAPNGRIVLSSGGEENEYGEDEATEEEPLVPSYIKVWVLISKPKQAILDARPAGSELEGLVEFTAKGTTRHPKPGDVLEVDGISYRVTEATPDSPAGKYVDGLAERMA